MKDEEKVLIAGVACFFVVLAILVVNYEVRERIDNAPTETLIEEYSEIDTFDYFQAEIDKAEAARKAAIQNNETELNVGDISDEEFNRAVSKFSFEPREELDIKHFKVLASTENPRKCTSDKVGSMIFVPASAGLLIASYILRDLIGEFNDA